MIGKNIIGKWIMVVDPQFKSGVPIIPFYKIEEYTLSHYNIYDFDIKTQSLPFKLDAKNELGTINDTTTFNYEINCDVLVKKYLDEDKNSNNVKYLRLIPSEVHFPVEKILSKRFKISYKDNSGQQKSELLDFTNPNPKNTNLLAIEKIDNTYFITCTYLNGRSWVIPIKKIQEDHLVVYGIDGKTSILKEIAREKSKQITLKERDLSAKSKLTLILDDLEDHLNELKAQIEKCAKNWEFETAQYLVNAFYKNKHKYNTLASLENKHHQDIEFTKRMLAMEKKRSNESMEKYQLDFRHKIIEDYEFQLHRLISEKPVFMPGTTNLKSAIEKLLRGKISQITLHLKEKYNTHLQINLKNTSMVFVLFCNNNEMYLDCSFKKLKQLGFVENDSTYILILENRYCRLEKIMEILSRFTFEVFHYESFDNPLKLEIS